jgi:hypothetical protein
MRGTDDAFVFSPVVDMLKAHGFKKRLLQGPRQFIYDTFLSYQSAAEACLPYTIFAGPPTADLCQTQCWTGSGQYLGRCGSSNMDEFFRKRMNGFGVLLIVNIAPFFPQICDLLDPISEVGLPPNA